MNEITHEKMFDVYMKYAKDYGVENDTENLEEMWWEELEDMDDETDIRIMHISDENIKLVEELKSTNLTTEEQIYIALKVGMLM